MTAGDGYLYQTEFFDVEQSDHSPLMRGQVPQTYEATQNYDPHVVRSIGTDEVGNH